MRKTSHRPRAVRIALAALTLGLLALPAMAEETVESIVAKNLESLGGLDAIKAVDSMLLTGTMTMGGNMEAPFTILKQRPNKVRMEFHLQGMTGVQAYDGTIGWSEMPFMGQTEPQKMADDQLKQTRQQAEFDPPLVDWQDRGHKVELLGKEDLEGTEAYKLKITLADGDEVISYLDTEYCLELRQERKVVAMGNEADLSIEIGDYKEVGDLVIPHSFEQRFAGAAAGQTLTIQTIELGVEVEDGVFSMPEPEAEEPEAEEAAAGGR